MAKPLEWYQLPLRISDFIPPTADEFEKLDVEKDYELRKDMGFNTEHFEVRDVDMGESGIAFYNDPHDTVARRDMLEAFLKEGRKHNKNIIVYFNVHWLAQNLTDKYPAWSQRGADGNIIKASYGNGSYCCVNTAFRKFALDAVHAIAQYAIDGIFLDGPIVYEKGCFCEGCRRLFVESHGYDLNYMPEMGTKEWDDWFLFKRQSIADFMKDSRMVLKSARPDAVIYMNSPQLLPSRLCGRDNRMTEPYQDMMLAEGGFLYNELEDIPIWKPAASAMLMECQAEGKPCIIAIAGRQGPWSRYFLTEYELRFAHWFTFAHGASSWYGIYGELKGDKLAGSVRKINSFLEENKDAYVQTESAASVALMWSPSTANLRISVSEKTDFTDAHEGGDVGFLNDMKRSFNGWFDLLSRSRQVFDIVDEYAVEDGRLARYRLLVLPATACLSRKCCEAIETFVKSGGKLIATYDTGLYDETGAEYAVPPLSAVLGVASYHGPRKNAFDHIETNGSGLFDRIEQRFLPSGHLGMLVSPMEGAKAAGYYRSPQPAVYCTLPEVIEHPYILENLYGSGASILFTANADAFFGQYKLPEYKYLMQNAVDSLFNADVVMQTPNDVDSLHISLRKQNRRLILHIINYTAGMMRPIDRVVELRDIAITFRGIGRSFAKLPVVRALAAKQQLEAVQKGDDLEIILPVLADYEVLVLEV